MHAEGAEWRTAHLIQADSASATPYLGALLGFVASKATECVILVPGWMSAEYSSDISPARQPSHLAEALHSRELRRLPNRRTHSDVLHGNVPRHRKEVQARALLQALPTRCNLRVEPCCLATEAA